MDEKEMQIEELRAKVEDLQTALARMTADENGKEGDEAIAHLIGPFRGAICKVPGGARGMLGCLVLGIRVPPGDAWIAGNGMAVVRKFAARWLRASGKWIWAKSELNRLKRELEQKDAEIQGLRDRVGAPSRGRGSSPAYPTRTTRSAF